MGYGQIVRPDPAPIANGLAGPAPSGAGFAFALLHRWYPPKRVFPRD